jgi:hypothetical protein
MELICARSSSDRLRSSGAARIAVRRRGDRTHAGRVRHVTAAADRRACGSRGGRRGAVAVRVRLGGTIRRPVRVGTFFLVINRQEAVLVRSDRSATKTHWRLTPGSLTPSAGQRTASKDITILDVGKRGRWSAKDGRGGEHELVGDPRTRGDSERVPGAVIDVGLVRQIRDEPQVRGLRLLLMVFRSVSALRIFTVMCS